MKTKVWSDAEERIVNRLMLLKHPKREEIIKRVVDLHKHALEDEPYDFPLNYESIDVLIILINKLGECKLPSLVITPHKNLQVQWGRKYDDRKLVAELYPNKFISYIITQRKHKKCIRVSVVSPIEEFFTVIKDEAIMSLVLMNEMTTKVEP